GCGVYAIEPVDLKRRAARARDLRQVSAKTCHERVTLCTTRFGTTEDLHHDARTTQGGSTIRDAERDRASLVNTTHDAYFARRRHEHDRHDRRRADANEGRHADLFQEIVPIADSALLAVKLVRKATLKVYPGAPH